MNLDLKWFIIFRAFLKVANPTFNLFFYHNSMTNVALFSKDSQIIVFLYFVNIYKTLSIFYILFMIELLKMSMKSFLPCFARQPNNQVNGIKLETPSQYCHKLMPNIFLNLHLLLCCISLLFMTFWIMYYPNQVVHWNLFDLTHYKQ